TGALALQRWLDSLGYQTANLEYTGWAIPDDAAALFMITPVREPIRDEEAQEILRWVRAGGTLIAVDERPQRLLKSNGLWETLQVTAAISEAEELQVAGQATVAQPLLVSPPVSSVPVSTTGALRIDDGAYVTLLQTHFGPTLIGRQEGRGYMYLSVAAHPFTNAGLREPGSAALVLNLLSRVPRGATVLFDEFHHGFTTKAAAAQPSLRRIVLSQWWGWAAVYAAGVLALYLVLTGRRFGRPIPLRRDIVRRSSAEYVQSMADLLRRSGKREHIAQHYHASLKRRLARPYGFIPPADDDAFVRELIRLGGVTEQQGERVRDLLHGLSRANIKDADLLRLLHELDTLADERGRLRAAEDPMRRAA
ncbi:MAG TPA: DUF4350 domain-containing protein, partial [Herpetosiphonaceae bacterium]|nr:DUF4350 domain-containing protein [Herpetosiphonaceae bacterium]